MTANSFSGKAALVVGGSSGIGKATAKQLLDNGATVYIVPARPAHVVAATKELG